MCAVAGIMISACSSGGGSSDQAAPDALKVLMPSQADVLDPTRVATLSEAPLLLGLEPLLRYQPDGTLAPNLASKVDKPDPTTYTFTIRPGVTFWDGTPLTADDVLYSLDLHAAKDSKSLIAGVFADVESIEKTGDLEVTVKLAKADPQFEYGIATTPIVSKAFTSKHPKDIGTPQVLNMGTGPYKFVSFTPSKETVLEANDDYWGDAPTYDQLTLSTVSDDAARVSSLQSNEYDAIYNIPIAQYKTFEGIGGLDLAEADDLSIYKVNFDLTKKPWDDIHLRRAVMYATDREGLVQGALQDHATLASTIVPEGIMSSLVDASTVKDRYASLESGFEYNLDKAKAELAQSSTPGGLTVDVSVLASDPNLSLVAQSLQASLKKIGITMRIKQVDDNTYYEQVYFKHTTQGLSLDNLSGINPDPVMMPFYVLNSAFSVVKDGPGSNLSDYVNPEVDSLIVDSQSKAVDDPARGVQIMDAIELAQKDLPFVPIAFPKVYAGAVQPLKIQNLDSFWWMTDWPRQIVAR